VVVGRRSQQRGISIGSSVRRRLLACAVFASSPFAFASPARADEPKPAAAQPANTAEDLFQQAKVLLANREFARACPMLLESYRLDPAGGTLQNLAICNEELGRWATAYARFQELRALSKVADPPRPDRVKLADEHIAKLTPKLSRVVVVMPAETASTAVVTLDKVTYLQPSWSTGILVDPGDHELEVSAPGKKPFHASVSIPSKSAARQEVNVPALEDAPVAASPTASAPNAVAPSTPAPTSSPFRTTGIVIGAVGLGVLVVGGVFGVLTFTTNAAAKDKCSADANPNANPADFDASGRCFVDTDRFRSANDLTSDARTFANVANVLVPVGLAAAGVGAYLAFIHKDTSAGSRARVRIAPTLGGASLSGTF
jgi:hypothetical protein